eukprot:m51a1_g3868 hypothetical protein (231) ;mRNA; r:428446-429489
MNRQRRWAFSVLSRGASCFADVASAALRHVGCAQALGVGEGAIAGFPQSAVPGADALDSWAFSVLSRGASCFADVASAALRHVGCAQALGVGEGAIAGFAMVALLGGSALEHRLLDNLDAAACASLRKNVIGLILATGMDQHAKVVDEFRSLTAEATGSSGLNAEAKFSTMKMLMKLADASNNACLAKLQANFLKIICVPMFQAYNDFLAIPIIRAQLAENQRYWEGQRR